MLTHMAVEAGDAQKRSIPFISEQVNDYREWFREYELAGFGEREREEELPSELS